MDEDETVVFSHPANTPFGALLRIHHLFNVIAAHHGEEIARKMFQEAGTPLSRRRQQERARWFLLERYDAMTPKPNVDSLARKIAEQEPERTFEAIEAQIYEAIGERKKKLAAGKWRGPGAPALPPEGAIIRITTR
jgi:hypothetical protein